ncbi:MAG: TM1812 family CRISPR-associated protein [Treponema sp.]|nr:TM1812 family CRISPR-associated protein [Treponema sp.]
MKVVIITVPMKPPQEISKVQYPVDGNKSIEYDKPVRCPINGVLAKSLQKGEEVKVIYIMTSGDNSECPKNKDEFINELAVINQEIGATFRYDTVDIAFLPTKQTYNKLITDLAEKIPENAEIYTDITYGFKPEILSLFCALRFVEEFRDAIVQFIIYGKAEFNKTTRELENPKLFDITSLYYLFKLMGTMGASNAETAAETLKDFFAM